MTTRFRLSSDIAAPPVSPSFQSYTHGGAISRINMPVSDSTGLLNIGTTPDAADHLVAGDTGFAQYISAQMAAGNVFTSGDVLKMAMQVSEDNAANNLFLQCFVSVVDSAGTTVQATIRSKVADNTELATTRTTRFHSTTLSGSYTTVLNDRLVVELSFTGTPTGAGGVQGHNGTSRHGANGAGGDLAENDTETGTTFNPWIEFATTITFPAAAAGPRPRRRPMRTWSERVTSWARARSGLVVPAWTQERMAA